ncbi:MAG: right-handed parallel beta-helix repeat-containing protein [Planctomycetota bacterium]
MRAAAILPLVVALSSSFVGPARAQATLNVPSPATSIQAAINAAVDGDTVLVGPGVWFEHIDFGGRNIHVLGQGPGVTTIDGGGTGTVVRFDSGETSGAVLEGFTIANGRGDPYLFGSSTIYPGGGIVVAGIPLGLGYTQCDPVIRNCVIENCFGTDGAGIWVFGYSRATLEDCVVKNSLAVDPLGILPVGSSQLGPGAGVETEFHSWVEMTGCVIESNAGVGLYLKGGNIHHSILERCDIRNNNLGGVVAMTSPHEFRSCRITGNVSAGPVGGLTVASMGLPGSNGSRLLVENCLIADNTSLIVGGGGIYAPYLADILVRQCTIANNTAPTYGAIFGNAPSDVSVENCIVYGNGPAASYVAPSIYGGLDFTSCCVEGGATGTGNFDLDPQFVDAANGDFGLAFGSPAIDAGDNSLVPPTATDLAGVTRILNGSVDVGAYESDEIANHGSAAGTLVDPGTGNAFRAIRVNGDDGGADFRVTVPAFSPWSLGFTSPPWMVSPPDFAIFGALAEATIETVVNVPLGVGEMSFLPCALQPQFEGPVFTLTSTIPLPCNAVLPSVPGSTWTTPIIPGLPGPIDVSFQGVVLDAGGAVATTNLLIVNIR